MDLPQWGGRHLWLQRHGDARAVDIIARCDPRDVSQERHAKCQAAIDTSTVQLLEILYMLLHVCRIVHFVEKQKNLH